MDSVLSEKAVKKHTEATEKEEALEIILQKCGRVLPPITGKDYLYMEFLAEESKSLLEDLKSPMEEDKIRICANGHVIYADRVHEIKEMRAISSNWKNYTLKEKILNYHLIDRYDEIRREIDEGYEESMEDGTLPYFIEKIKEKIKEDGLLNPFIERIFSMFEKETAKDCTEEKKDTADKEINRKILKPEKNKKNRAIVQLDKETGQSIAQYESIAEAIRALGLKNGTRISGCCLGKFYSAYGFQWKYAD
jgi:hypothetical protein